MGTKRVIDLQTLGAINDTQYVLVDSSDGGTKKFDINQLQTAIDNVEDGTAIESGAITTAKLAASAVTSAKIADGNVTADKINDSAVTTAKINNGAVTEAKIDSGAVTSGKIGSGAVGTSHLASNAVTTAKIADSNVTTAKINDSAVTTAKINNGAVTADKLGSGAVTSAKINDSAVTTAKINNSAVTEAKINDGAVTSGKLASSSVTTDKINNGAVTLAKIASGSEATSSASGLMSSSDKSKLDGFSAASNYALKTDLTNVYKYKGSVATESNLPTSGRTAGDVYNIIAASSYGAAGTNVAWTGSAWDALGETFELADGTVTTAKLANAAITEGKINDSAVTSGKIAGSAVTEGKISNGAVTADKIGSNAVTEGKINNGAVTTNKIADSAVTSGKLSNGAVLETKINDGAVTAGKIGSGAVTEAKIGSGAVTEGKIGSGAVTNGKLADNAVTTAKIVDANVTEAKLASAVIQKINNGESYGKSALTILRGMDAMEELSWPEIAQLADDAANGNDALIGMQIVDNFADNHGSSVVNYDCPYIIQHFQPMNMRNHTNINMLVLGMLHALPFATQFDAKESFYAVPAGGISAGTYYFTFGTTWGSKIISGNSYNFTLANGYSEGAQFEFSGDPYSNDAATMKVNVYSAAGDDNYAEQCQIGTGVSGTFLGTIQSTQIADGSSVNHLQRCIYGNNRWDQSAIRQFLNSDDSFGGQWWSPQNKWDRPPSYRSYKGFLTMLPSELLEVIQEVEVKTALSYSADSGTSSQVDTVTTYDKIWLPSWEQHYLKVDSSYGGTAGAEGEAFKYWKNVAGVATPWAAGTTHAEFIHTGLELSNGVHPARTVFLRGPYRSNGSNVTSVNSSGNCSYNNAINGYYVVPACAIRKALPST